MHVRRRLSREIQTYAVMPAYEQTAKLLKYEDPLLATILHLRGSPKQTITDRRAFLLLWFILQFYLPFFIMLLTQPLLVTLMDIQSHRLRYVYHNSVVSWKINCLRVSLA